MIPAVTLVLSVLILEKEFNSNYRYAVSLVCLGVIIASAGEVDFQWVHFSLWLSLTSLGRLLFDPLSGSAILSKVHSCFCLSCRRAENGLSRVVVLYGSPVFHPNDTLRVCNWRDRGTVRWHTRLTDQLRILLAGTISLLIPPTWCGSFQSMG